MQRLGRLPRSMRKSRITSLEWVRGIAILLVLFCHYGQSVGWEKSGIAGGVANCIFFLLSGIVLGYTWRNTGGGKLGVDFLFRRFAKLYVPFILFLVPYSIILAINDNIGIVDIILNFLMLSWFRKLAGAGHLWFVTGISILYLLIFAVSHLRKINTLSPTKGGGILIIICILMQYGLVKFGIKQAYFVMLLVSGVITFLYGDIVMNTIVELRNYKVLGVVISILITVVLILIKLEVKRVGYTLYYWICMLVATFVVIICGIAIRANGVPRLVGWISAMSYELYLVHYPFCMKSPLFVGQIMENRSAYAVCFLGVTTICAFLLKSSSNYISCVIKK